MKSIDLNIKSVEVKASVRPIKSKWTSEMSTDIQHLTDMDLSSFERYFLRELRRENRKDSINKIFKK